MRSPIALSILPMLFTVVAIGCAPPPPAPPPVDTAAITAEIGQVEVAYTAAMAARDTTALMNYYSDDAAFLPSNGPRADGHAAIAAAYREMLAIPGLDLVLQSSAVTVSQAGDLAIDVGSYRMKMTGPRGKPTEDVGKFVTVFKKTDAGWKAIIDTFNSDMPLPGQGK
jgi:uncharacterized protein (TIGR02246 family)